MVQSQKEITTLNNNLSDNSKACSLLNCDPTTEISKERVSTKLRAPYLNVNLLKCDLAQVKSPPALHLHFTYV